MALQAGYREPLHKYLRVIDQSLRQTVGKREELRAPEMGITVLVHALHGALEHAAMHSDWMEDEAKYEAFVQELSVLGYGYLTADRTRWAQILEAAKSPPVDEPWALWPDEG